MIPDRDDFWLSVATSKPSAPPASAAVAASGDQLLLSTDNNRQLEAGRQTAWRRYCCYVQAMESRGQNFDQKLILEAMFRGNNLVYSAASECSLR